MSTQEEVSMSFQEVLEAFETDFHTSAATPLKKSHHKHRNGRQSSQQAASHTSRSRGYHQKTKLKSTSQSSKNRKSSNEEEDHLPTAASWRTSESACHADCYCIDEYVLKQSPYDVQFDVLGNTLYETLQDCFARTNMPSTATGSVVTTVTSSQLQSNTIAQTCQKFRFEASLDNIFITEDQLFAEESQPESEEFHSIMNERQLFVHNNISHHRTFKTHQREEEGDCEEEEAETDVKEVEEESEDTSDEESLSSVGMSIDEDKENKDPLVKQQLQSVWWEGGGGTAVAASSSAHMHTPLQRQVFSERGESTQIVSFSGDPIQPVVQVNDWQQTPSVTTTSDMADNPLYNNQAAFSIEEEEEHGAFLAPSLEQLDDLHNNASPSFASQTTQQIQTQLHQQQVSSRMPATVRGTGNSLNQRTPLRDITYSGIASSSKKSGYKGVKKTLQFSSPSINAWTLATDQKRNLDQASSAVKNSPLPALLFR